MRARAGTVDLVGHQKLGEDRPRNEAEAALPGLTFLKHFGAENVRGHQVRSELNALRIKSERNPHGLDELGLGETRHADKEAVAAAEYSDERLIDYRVLAEDHISGGSLGRAHVVGACLRRAHNHVFQLFEPFSADSGHRKLLFASFRSESDSPLPNDCKRSTLHRYFAMQ